ncbi:hypothetical protein MPTK1_6g12940 [Marchantia polymorpha subsp. ruderalis]|uniref:Uncharacterized protein n=2 Tax=Marchantia polymorpha TaxID=3197 RepID=A0AAF6BRH0_MARPO|nr:hypothetical protein MARPO_0059s0054 [Marchantia polymorpha]BBN14604.1 hypothetical protein Mp_6g12940 [Marchantia polymorpha subsp. ruderalis]|eukprot:PTQ37117.1 hypothetical protein MARPO_0059s0054 [Marchantia polymorpha]
MTVKNAQPSTSRPSLVKFRMPTAENLIPMRLDVEYEGRRLKDAFTWNVDDPDIEIYPFVRRMAKDLNLPSGFTPIIAQQMQTQLDEFRSLEAQEMTTEERVQTLRDVNNFDSDPEGFARGLCKDLELEDPEVAPAIALSIREQLYEIAKQNIASGRETRISKKVRRESGVDFTQPSALGTLAVNLMRRPNSKISIVRRKNEWDMFEPNVEILSDREVEAIDAREERNARIKKRQEEKEDAYSSRYLRV